MEKEQSNDWQVRTQGRKSKWRVYEGAEGESDCAEQVPVLQRIPSRGWAQAGLYPSTPSLWGRDGLRPLCSPYPTLLWEAHDTPRKVLCSDSPGPSWTPWADSNSDAAWPTTKLFFFGPSCMSYSEARVTSAEPEASLASSEHDLRGLRWGKEILIFIRDPLLITQKILMKVAHSTSSINKELNTSPKLIMTSE